jgi:rubrerythrin
LRAFASETFTGRRYLAIAARAEEEGHQRTAIVFFDIARRRTSNAEEYLKMLGDLEAARRTSAVAGQANATTDV